jgi:hypothetical protein
MSASAFDNGLSEQSQDTSWGNVRYDEVETQGWDDCFVNAPDCNLSEASQNRSDATPTQPFFGRLSSSGTVTGRPLDLHASMAALSNWPRQN